jgi:hypothetical protein
MDKAEFDAITERIIGAAHKVSNNLGSPKVQIRRLHLSPTCKPQTWKYAKQ